MTDGEIIDRVLSGDQQAFALLVAAYQQKALSLAERLLQNRYEAEDLVQDAFVKAYTSLASFRGGSSFATWFYRIVYTTCLNALQKQRRMPREELLDGESALTWIEPKIFDEIDNNVIERVLREEMGLMPPLYAVVMELFYGEECSYEQIVKITGMPIGTVKTRLNRGRLLLRTALLKRCPDLEVSNVR
ncbi:MAG: sigma-70 family RNA polymerase sigma factor [Candidatus Kapabacteria bacterium]|nr:sigma-70 family RNA polymerase sigma factor [Candidatus Kapabacteria bacterium]